MSEPRANGGLYDFREDPHGLTREDVTPVDPYLEALLLLVLGMGDNADGSFGLTVMTGGTLVTGVAISLKEWERRWMMAMTEASFELTEPIEKVFNITRTNLEAVARQRQAENRPRAAMKFLNMRNVTITSPQGQYEMPLWRCRMSAIDGWTNTTAL